MRTGIVRGARVYETEELAMRVKDIMSEPVITVETTATLAEVAKVMLERHIGAVPVVTRQGRLAGIVSESNFAAEERGLPFCMLRLPQVLGRWLSKDNLERIYAAASAMTAADVMVTDVVTVAEEDPVEEAVRKMCESQVHRLPVVRSGVPVGMVTRHDLLTAMTRAGRRTSARTPASTRQAHRPCVPAS
jgi:CBS domain-containing protein